MTLHIVTDDEWWGDIKAKWLVQCLVVTGSPVDCFDRFELMSHFVEWMVSIDIDPSEDMTLTKTQVADELTAMIESQGLLWNPHRDVFQGGKLV